MRKVRLASGFDCMGGSEAQRHGRAWYFIMEFVSIGASVILTVCVCVCVVPLPSAKARSRPVAGVR